jgi:hypothetical protein
MRYSRPYRTILCSPVCHPQGSPSGRRGGCAGFPTRACLSALGLNSELALSKHSSSEPLQSPHAVEMPTATGRLGWRIFLSVHSLVSPVSPDESPFLGGLRSGLRFMVLPREACRSDKNGNKEITGKQESNGLVEAR